MAVPVERVLMLIHRSAGSGYGPSVAEHLRSILAASLPSAHLEVQAAGSHQEIVTRTIDYLKASSSPSALIAGGGGGTLRAVIEGICRIAEAEGWPDRSRVRVAPLRMGSGNVLAKQYGVPKDPEAALRGIAVNLQSDRTAPCCVIRCEAGTQDQQMHAHYAVTLGGFGQFGRVPGDLARWHRRLPLIHRILARGIGVENLTNVEYALVLLIRSVWCALFPSAVEALKITSGSQTQQVRLLTGLLMNFPFPALPLDPGVRPEDEAAALYLIPMRNRFSALKLVLASRRLVQTSVKIMVTKTDSIVLNSSDSTSVEFFLDEDPQIFFEKLKIQIAGSLAFVPGPEYVWPSEQSRSTLPS